MLIGVLVAFGTAADAPVAMRVELVPLDIAEGLTTVRVVIQVSPEDRARLGRNAIVRIELDGEVPRGQSPMFGVKIKDDGSAKVETAWPPGEHELQVEIESPSGNVSGLWVGRIRIPGGSQEPPPTPTPVPAPVIAPEIEAETVPESAPDEGGEIAIGTTAESAAVSAAVVETAVEPPQAVPDEATPPQSEARPVEPAEEPAAEAIAEEDELAPEPEPEVAMAEEPADGGPIAAGIAATASATSKAETPSDTPQDLPAPETAAEAPQPPVADEPPEPAVEELTATDSAPVVEEPVEEVEPVVVEPLRGQRVEVSVEGSEAVGDTARDSVAGKRTEFSPESAAAYESWAAGSEGSLEFTAIVTRNREPAEGLTTNDLTLKIGGSGVTIDRLGDIESAPLLLGVAVDISPETLGRWSGFGRRLEPLFARTGGGRGELYFSTAGDEGNWEEGSHRLTEILGSPSTGDLAALVSTSLEKFVDRRGRSFLLVITDGRGEPSKAAWREALATADVSGVPVLVIALWDKEFKQSARKQLQNIAGASGGRLFLAQGIDQLDSVAERYGIALDAGVAVRFQSPPGMKTPSAIDLKSGDRSLDVTAPGKTR